MNTARMALIGLALLSLTVQMIGCDEEEPQLTDPRCEYFCEFYSTCAPQITGATVYYDACLDKCRYQNGDEYVTDCSLECDVVMDCNEWWNCFACCEGFSNWPCED